MEVGLLYGTNTIVIWALTSCKLGRFGISELGVCICREQIICFAQILA